MFLVSALFRIARYQQFKNFEKRIMVATDLFGRGIDIERVNIVINYDMPDSTDSYLHRVRSFNLQRALSSSSSGFCF